MHRAAWWDDRRGVNGRHPNANLVLFEEIGDQLVKVDVGLRIVVVGKLMVVTVMISTMSNERKTGLTPDTPHRGSPWAAYGQRPSEPLDA